MLLFPFKIIFGVRLQEGILTDDFTERLPRWRWRTDGFATINIRESILEMCMGPTEALYYSNAEIADGEFNDLPWEYADVEFRVRLCGEHYGSAGWGFWNHSMRVDQSFPIWFIYLRPYGPYPLQGFFAQVGNSFYPIKLFKGITHYKISLTLLPWVAPIKILSAKPAAQDLNLTEWNTYGIRWRKGSVTFTINGKETASIKTATKGIKGRADVWIDNAVFNPPRKDPGRVFRHVTQENRQKTCLEIDWIKIKSSE